MVVYWKQDGEHVSQSATALSLDHSPKIDEGDSDPCVPNSPDRASVRVLNLMHEERSRLWEKVFQVLV